MTYQYCPSPGFTHQPAGMTQEQKSDIKNQQCASLRIESVERINYDFGIVLDVLARTSIHIHSRHHLASSQNIPK
jgi:hypothetical protein